MGRFLGGRYGDCFPGTAGQPDVKGIFTMDGKYYITQEGGWAIPFTASGGDSVEPSVTISGSVYTVHKFTNPGNFVINAGSKSYDVLIVAGGASGGVDNGGGGGAGGVVDAAVPASVVNPGTYGVSIGNGGAARPGPSDDGGGNTGSPSTMAVSPTVTLTANGGGAGCGWTNPSGTMSGGCGGGQSGEPNGSNGKGTGPGTQPGANPGVPYVTQFGGNGGSAYQGPQCYSGGGGGGGGNGSNASSGTAGQGGLGYNVNGKYGPQCDQYPSGRIAGGGTGGFDIHNGGPAP